MAGPDTPALAEAAVAGGADIIEIGFPFSDPLADGPVIRAAGERALAAGMRTAACLECLAETRVRVGETPLVPMTYASLLEAYGWERFVADSRAAGATGLIIADLPAGERTDVKRIQLVTLTGTTGARVELSSALDDLSARARLLTEKPLYAGFGISTPEQAAAAAKVADGVVVGSRAILVAGQGPEALNDYVASLRAALDAL